MTEEEAKTKWCPMVRWYGNANQYEDVFDNRGYNCTCVASGCMMWRWNYKKEENRDLYKDHDGYCGLAGKP